MRTNIRSRPVITSGIGVSNRTPRVIYEFYLTLRWLAKALIPKTLITIMHEYAITETILEIVEAEAVKAGARRVEEITVVIGELSSFTSESIRLYFQELCRGTLSDGAELVFLEKEARAVCGSCGFDFRPSQAFFVCPGCGSPVYELMQGNELYVDNIEVA